MSWRDTLIGMGLAILLTWLLLVVVLLIARPKGNVLREALRILPDLIRLLKNLATDKTLPGGVRIRLGLLMVYLALPFDLIPDFVPVLGYADDAIIVVAVLRSVVRRVGLEPLRTRWPGTDDGFAALCRAAGLGRDPIATRAPRELRPPKYRFTKASLTITARCPLSLTGSDWCGASTFRASCSLKSRPAIILAPRVAKNPGVTAFIWTSRSVM